MDPIGIIILETLASRQGTTPDDMVTRWALAAWANECHRAGAAGEPVPTLVLSSSHILPAAPADPNPTQDTPEPVEATTAAPTASTVEEEPEEMDVHPGLPLSERVIEMAEDMSVPFAARAISREIPGVGADEVDRILLGVSWPHRREGRAYVWLPQ